MRNKLITLIAIAISLFFIGRNSGLNFHQSMAIAIFSVSICGTLFFWDFRLTFAFLGTSVLLITKTIDMDHVIRFASLEVILFLIGMMVIVGLLKSAGFFAWIVSFILRIKNLTADKFLIIISISSALLACAVDEVTSIVFMVAAIFEICDYLEVEPTPFLMISVFATNIGSFGTVLGNPIGILIATKAGLTFEDFIIKAFPLMLVCLIALIFIVRRWYRRDLGYLDKRIKQIGSGDVLARIIAVPPTRDLRIGLGIFVATLVSIAFHHRLEVLMDLPPNTILLVLPLIASGGVMAWKYQKAREFIEKDVEWWTLLFFLLLFAQAGTLKYTGATDVLAGKVASFTASSSWMLSTFILWVSAIGSSVLDNVVLVAAFIPIVQSFKGIGVSTQSLWWALLFGGCLGGNITLVGSTANIVALGILEKEKNVKMTFFRWFWIGSVIGAVTTAVAWAAIVFLPFYR